MLKLPWWRLACWALMMNPSHHSIVRQILEQTEDARHALRANKEIVDVDKR